MKSGKFGEQDLLSPNESTEKELRDQKSNGDLVSAPPFPAIGAGLKRPLQLGEHGCPTIPKRQRLNRKKAQSSFPDEASWSGLDSSTEFSDSAPESFGISSETDEQSVDSDPASRSSREESRTSSDESDPEHQLSKTRNERSSVFKAWAIQQVNEAIGFTPTSNLQAIENQPYAPQIKLRPLDQDPLPPDLETHSKALNRQVFSVPVNRPPDILEARLRLPIVAEEQKIMEAIHNNPCVVIWGATGSGKTTQVPQFLYEAGYGSPSGPTPGMIGVTQPRRVAAVSMAERVGQELGKTTGTVSYQIRFESTTREDTSIKFMTDGILIREIAKDFALTKFSAIIVDEAHERSTNTDILIGMISRIVDLRDTMSRTDPRIKPLKLIIMSATLRISDFIENRNLFRNGAPPLVKAEGRQHSVSVHFSRKTAMNYLDEMFEKVSRGHRKLPAGGMLVFLTAPNEIISLAKRLKQTFPNRQVDGLNGPQVRIAATDAPLEDEDVEMATTHANDEPEFESENTSSDMDETWSRSEDEFDLGEPEPESLRIHVLPLYSKLPTKEQLRVFESPPKNTRFIVLATNVAETSLTIPGIRYVFDCGRVKEKKYDKDSGVQGFQVGWISKASASQRAGRAGRTGPGHCYRLYSSAVYERDFLEYSEPEILRTPVEGIVLQLKSMDLQHVLNFPFPTPPERHSLEKAERLLTYLNALSKDGKITLIGRDLSIYPLSPRLSKMLLIGHQHSCMPYTIAMVAALAVPEIFIPESQLDLSDPPHDPNSITTTTSTLEASARESRRKAYHKPHHLFSKNSPTSDAIKLLTALCAYAYAPEPSTFCTEMCLHSKALSEASQLREQLTSIVRLNRPGLLSTTYQPLLPSPSEKQLKALQQIAAAGYIDQIAIRADLSPNPPDIPRKPKRAIDVPYFPLFRTHLGKAVELDDKAVYIHPSSVLASLSPPNLPQYLVYSTLQQSPSPVSSSTNNGSAIKTPKIRMHALTPLSGSQLAALARGTPLIEFSKPVGKVVVSETDPRARECWVVPSLVGDRGSGNVGWPLPVEKVRQVRDGRGVWRVEE